MFFKVHKKCSFFDLPTPILTHLEIKPKVKIFFTTKVLRLREKKIGGF